MKSPPSYPNPLLRGWRLPEGVAHTRPFYSFMRTFFRVTVTAFWKVRVFNRHFEPATGSAVYICNHQSFMDPMLMGMPLYRPMNFMARDSLFRVKLFKLIIEAVNAFPVKRGTADLGAIKEAMRRLKNCGQVVVFAEGTRTQDGRIAPFLPGVAMLSQRAADWTVPVVIDGAFEAWPRTSPLPMPGSITVQYGKPIPQSEARGMSSEEFVERVRREMIGIQADMRRRAGRTPLRYD